MQTRQDGSILSILIIVILLLALIGAGTFGFMASSERDDYKNNVDAKVAVAVEDAKKAHEVELRKQFDEESKSPHKPYKSSVSSGSVSFSYPKTWSAYVTEDSGNQPIEGFFHPDVVPGDEEKTSYALRVEMLNTDYSQVVSSLATKTKQGALQASAYIPPKMKDVPNAQPGTRFDGEIDREKRGAMVVLKVRDKTLKIYTESTNFVSDFNNVILPSLTYSP